MLEGLSVDPARMWRNLDTTRGMISAEAVMMALAPHVGREEAHHLVAAACDRALAHDRHLLEELQADAAITAHLPRERLVELLDPGNYTGLAAEFVDRVLARAPGKSE
jgi:3-carboxy-cis,cis-muconate cycloisomerase